MWPLLYRRVKVQTRQPVYRAPVCPQWQPKLPVTCYLNSASHSHPDLSILSVLYCPGEVKHKLGEYHLIFHLWIYNQNNMNIVFAISGNPYTVFPPLFLSSTMVLPFLCPSLSWFHPHTSPTWSARFQWINKGNFHIVFSLKLARFKKSTFVSLRGHTCVRFFSSACRFKM